MVKTTPFSMTTSNCFSGALSLSTLSLEHFEALSTASPAPHLAATVLLMGFHTHNIETRTKEQGERRRVSRFAVSLAAGLPLWKRVTQDGLFPEATLQRELMINPSCLVCRTFLTAGDLAPDSPCVCHVKLLKQLKGWFL